MLQVKYKGSLKTGTSPSLEKDSCLEFLKYYLCDSELSQNLQNMALITVLQSF